MQVDCHWVTFITRVEIEVCCHLHIAIAGLYSQGTKQRQAHQNGEGLPELAQ